MRLQKLDTNDLVADLETYIAVLSRYKDLGWGFMFCFKF